LLCLRDTGRLTHKVRRYGLLKPRECIAPQKGDFGFRRYGTARRRVTSGLFFRQFYGKENDHVREGNLMEAKMAVGFG
jgi:hypothetical protein